MYEKILVPVDGSRQALAALEVAVHLLSGPAPEVHLLTVPELPRTEGELRRWAQGGGGAETDAEAGARKVLADAEAAAGTSGPRFVHHLMWTAPATAIVDTAQELSVDAIVLGSRGLGNLKGLIIGSVSNKVLHTAPCRVVLVH
mgnify:CR=1 FL=1